MTTTGPVVSVDGLTVRYRDVVALDNVSFTAQRGQIVAVVGASGAGKSTLLQVLTGTLSPTSGRYELMNGQASATVGFVPQLDRSGDDCPLHAAEVVALGMPRSGVAVRRSERAQARLLLDRLGLAGLAHRRLSELSGGQRQRVSIARALATGADVLLCDEPTSGADPVRVAEIMQMLTSIADAGAVVLLTTHDIDRVARQADLVVALRAGAVVYCGPAASMDDDVVAAVYRTDVA
jgi:ABC-type Mn2+/Zn2+ transport system ATPase subunit